MRALDDIPLWVLVVGGWTAVAIVLTIPSSRRAVLHAWHARSWRQARLVLLLGLLVALTGVLVVDLVQTPAQGAH